MSLDVVKRGMIEVEGGQRKTRDGGFGRDNGQM